MIEVKEISIVNQVPSWHHAVCLKCNKYLSIVIFFLAQEGLSVKQHYIGLSIVFSSSMLETIDNWRYSFIYNMCIAK